MARINFPNTFAGVVKLFRAAKTKYDAEAGASKLQPFLDEDDIDMDVDEAAVDAAEDAHDDFEKAEKEAEKQREARDTLFNPTFVFLEAAVQSLKKLYHKHPHKLGDWTITVDGESRIVYPPDFFGRQLLVLSFIAKHESFAPLPSPLQPYLDENDINIVEMKTDAANALPLHDEFETQDALKEEKREERDNFIDPVEQHLRGIAQYLVGLYPDTPHKASDWGYEVNDSPQEDVERDGVVKFSSSKTLQQLAIGTVISNNGSVAWKLYRGKTTDGEPVVMNPGDKFTIARGFGTSTIKNENPSQDGTYNATFLK